MASSTPGLWENTDQFSSSIMQYEVSYWFHSRAKLWSRTTIAITQYFWMWSVNIRHLLDSSYRKFQLQLTNIITVSNSIWYPCLSPLKKLNSSFGLSEYKAGDLIRWESLWGAGRTLDGVVESPWSASSSLRASPLSSSCWPRWPPSWVGSILTRSAACDVGAEPRWVYVRV